MTEEYVTLALDIIAVIAAGIAFTGIPYYGYYGYHEWLENKKTEKKYPYKCYSLNNSSLK